MTNYEKLIGLEKARFIEDQEKYSELVRKARLVHKPVSVPLWHIVVSDAAGNIHADRRSFAHSWTRVFYNAHTEFSMFTTAGTPGISDGAVEGELGVKDVVGGIQNNWEQLAYPEPHVFGGGYGAPASDDTYGNIVGTGTTADDFEDFQIEGKISDGNGIGELEYGLASLAKGWNVGNRYWYSQWERSFLNAHANAITVGNMAMYFKSYGGNPYCFIRDVLSPDEGLANGETLTVTYELRQYFP